MKEGSAHSENAYFAASNSYKGFISYFDDIFRRKDISHLYIIKGGPGTGKSRFMREIGESASAFGMDVEYYYCSSDQSSLDGIIIYNESEGARSATAIIDGTAPHSYDTVCPGAREDIINLGQFWKRDVLSGYKDELDALNAVKARHYSAAYSYLEASHSIKKIIDSYVLKYFDRDKISEFVDKAIKNADLSAGNGTVIPALIDSVGTLGEIRYDSFSPNAEKVICITDFCGTSGLVIGEFFEKLHRDGVDMKISYDPIEPETVNGLITDDCKLAVIRCDTASDMEENASREVHSIREFTTEKVERAERSIIRHLSEMRSSLITLALSELDAAGKTHFEIEAIYISAMDFRAKEEFSEKFRSKLFN